MEEPPRRSLQVEPAAVARRRSSLGALLVAGAAAAFVVVAVVKPWDGAGPAGSTRPSAEAAGSPQPPTTATPLSATPGPTPIKVRVADEDLLAATSPRSSWGVRAVVLPTGPVRALEERWTPIDDPGYRTEADTRTVAASAPIAGDGEAVLALGVTTPADALPLDVRIWRMDTDGIPQRVAPVAVPGPDPGSWLWRPAAPPAIAGTPWPAGTYRIDVLLGRSIDRIVVVVPGDASPVHRGEPVPALPPDLGSRLGPSTGGLFVIAGGRTIEVAAQAAGLDRASLGERAAWLRPGPGGEPAVVGRVIAADVAGIGLRLPGAVAPSLALRLLSPVQASVIAQVELVALSRSTAVLAHVGRGRPFGAGIYRLWATWTTADGEPRSEIRFLEIAAAGTTTPPGSPIESLRMWAGLAQHPDDIAGEPLVTDADLDPGDSRGTCGGPAVVTGSTPLIGLVVPDGDRVVDIRLTAPDGYTRIDTRAMLPGADGLALLALPSGGLIPARYRIDVTRTVASGSRAPESDTRATSYGVCIR